MRHAIAALLVGCGRIAFDPVDDAAGRSGGDADATSTCPSFAILCDDFESGTLDKWDVIKTSAGGTVVVDSLTPHGGTHAADATMPAAGNGSVAAACKLLSPTTSGMLAIRGWFYSTQTLDNYTSVMRFTANSCGSPPTEYAIAGCAGGLWDVTEDSSSGGLVDHMGATCPPIDPYTCIELDYMFGPPPHVQLYANDVLVVDAAASDSTPMYDDVSVGIARANATGYQDFVDDVVLAPQHIGCN